AVFSLCRWADEHHRACRPGQAASGLLPGFDDALRAQERRTDGGDHGAGADCGTASIAAAFYWRRKVVGREGPRQGARIGAAGDGAPAVDRGLDHRRYELSQEGTAFGRGGATILRPAWQAGQL